ncbi:MAG: putative PIN family toxin of toxin-antitoxin system [Saprospiraceae bacterium]
MNIVLDTNVLLVSISPKSKFNWVFQKFIDEEYTLCVTTDILQEYEEIIGKHMGVEAANFVLQIIESAVNVNYITNYFKWNLITIDPDDNKFVDCAVSCNARFIVTHDKHFNILKKIEFPKIEVVGIEYFRSTFNKIEEE